MEENTQKFLERMNELVALGKKKKSILDVQEINDFFSDMELTTEQMEKVFDYLEANNIDVLRISGDTDDDADVDIDDIISEEEEVDMENIDLSVPEGVSIEDPVRMYLKEIGKVPLPVSYTHLDVYKRQGGGDASAGGICQLPSERTGRTQTGRTADGLCSRIQDSERRRLQRCGSGACGRRDGDDRMGSRIWKLPAGKDRYPGDPGLAGYSGE